jgi:hypothetical protein
MDIANENRYEIKMVYDKLRIWEVRQWVRNHSSAFRTAYPTRLVNNIYFDTDDLGTFNDHISGCGSRQKLRFRWYHEENGLINGQLEVKRKVAMIGTKYIQPITDIDLTHDTWKTIQQKMLDQTENEMNLLLQSSLPVVISAYMRDYFVTADGGTRLTLDYDMKAWDQRVYDRPNLRNRIPLADRMVIEFKRDMHDHVQFADVLAEFPLRATPFSKYVDSMNAILGW